MEFLPWLIGLVCLILLVLFGRLYWKRICRHGAGDWLVGLIKELTGIPIRFFWRARYIGFDKIPQEPFEHGLILVSNHTSGLDPALIDCGVDFRIRWLMWRAMMLKGLNFLWRRIQIIPVDLSSADRAAVREAIKAIRAGGVVGIFPEGGIERPARQIMPFHPGVGFLIARTKAPVALIHISGVAETKAAYSAFFRPCRARIEVIELLEYDDERDPATITQDLRDRLSQASGWPLVDEPTPEADPAPPVVPSERG